jgi:hypothetical protein
MVILDADDNLVHSEMRFGDGLVIIGNEWSDDHKSPASLGGKNTQSVHLQITSERGGDVDSHASVRAMQVRASGGTGDAVLRRPHLPRRRSGGTHLDVCPDRQVHDA